MTTERNGMADESTPGLPDPEPTSPDGAPVPSRESEAADRENWTRYALTCQVLEHVESMLELADEAELPEATRALLREARREAQRIIGGTGFRDPSSARH